jgi:hypothetical protein
MSYRLKPELCGSQKKKIGTEGNEETKREGKKDHRLHRKHREEVFYKSGNLLDLWLKESSTY